MQSLFQFTPLREGRRPLSSRGFINIYFNSRPSARGDETGIHMRDCARISIHAPPRGATIAWVNGGFSGLISIHAPPRGATSKVSGAVRQGNYYNSRPSARGDTAWCWTSHPVSKFQFTPLREGRHERKNHEYLIRQFQFTPLREGRQRAAQEALTRIQFQFTPLREGRQPRHHNWEG